MKAITEIGIVVIGSLLIGFIGHYLGENIALAIIGGWVFLTTFNK